MVINEPPSTPADLYDHLRATFGIGSYDEMFGEPWYKARIAEIGKLKAALRRRRIDIRDAYDAAEYARVQRLPITEMWQVLDLVGEVRLQMAKDRRASKFRIFQVDLEEAISQAHEAGADEWLTRLLNADPTEAPQVVKEWRQWCSQQQ